MAKFSEYLSLTLLILILAHVGPSIFNTIKDRYYSLGIPCTKVGIIPIKGMCKHAGIYTKQLTSYFKDPTIKAIVLHIESPGGSSSAAQALFSEIKELKSEHAKTIITLVENSCLSAAYYIACATDYIIAQPSSFIGSISPNFAETITLQVPTSPSPESNEMLKRISQETYNQFIHDVASRRPKLSVADTSIWASGHIFTGERALTLGLIDELGYMSTLERALRFKAPIEGEIIWICPEERACASSDGPYDAAKPRTRSCPCGCASTFIHALSNTETCS